ncbi:xylan glycosyltransferase MUCI21-like [Impatiens glandulifera]|uniref:xylan glycosyltransferase MUCI21-like n=1 Tax=Impatiens glandulifera TaxID=253017 RepID=UPI001FB0648F|nr:xylan glycosyltransferase MUCI21-like [Impatiens glandulifera]
MVHHLQRNQLLWKKGLVQINGQELEDDQRSLNLFNGKKTRPILVYFLLISLIISCSFIFGPQLSFRPDSSYSSFIGDDSPIVNEIDVPLCSSVANGTICCDRSSIRSDICIMKGDVRTHSSSSSIYVYDENEQNREEFDGELQQEENIRPYTRKWESQTMSSVSELHLISKRVNPDVYRNHTCDIIHNVPAVFFSTAGYTGNVYHEFNDGILPLYITSQRFNKKVVFVIEEYHDWWYTKYADVLSELSDYAPIDFHGDKRTHCFPEAIVGLKIHDELTVDPSLMEGSETVKDFRQLLDRAYWPRISGLIKGGTISPALSSKPKLTIISRQGSRAILNENSLVKMAEEIGFEVEILKPAKTSELAKIYQSLNSSDVMIGVHGAAMTHFLFMRPGSVFIQVIPLGTEWAAETYYGEPAVRLGCKYVGYKILPKESSLYDEYDRNDPVLNDPDSIGKKGWEFTKKIYLDRQNVRLNLARFRKRLVRSYAYSMAKKNRRINHPSK